MATDALAMTIREQRGRRHDGPSLAVTLDASAERVRGRSVLVRVARRAHAVGRLSLRSMFGVDVSVAARAVRRDRCSVLVRAMTAQALARGVRDDRRDAALIFQMTASAVLGAEGLEDTAVELIVGVAVTRECMTHHAVGLGIVSEARRRLARSVLDSGLIRVTGGAAARRHGSNGRAVERVATTTGNALLEDVHLMANGAAVRAPLRLDVQALAWCAADAMFARRDR